MDNFNEASVGVPDLRSDWEGLLAVEVKNGQLARGGRIGSGVGDIVQLHEHEELARSRSCDTEVKAQVRAREAVLTGEGRKREGTKRVSEAPVEADVHLLHWAALEGAHLRDNRHALLVVAGGALSLAQSGPGARTAQILAAEVEVAIPLGQVG
eukprot:TRINITY_DN62434_c0_g1_i1.p1 TRINITY_DN62434_c0_g1~~TRINITY_DN62434_c0_g1_i1.p1  ORF type:complete len:154 (-),score=17.33 TRINITY_DN62434_c0_g1_i1:17-478(-)